MVIKFGYLPQGYEQGSLLEKRLVKSGRILRPQGRAYAAGVLGLALAGGLGLA